MSHIKLIEIRKERNISQIEMADFLAMEQTTYSRKERGLSRIRKNEWEKIAKILEVPVDEICDDGTFKVYQKSSVKLNDVEEFVQVNKSLFSATVRYIKKLEDEIDYLKLKTKNVQ